MLTKAPARAISSGSNLIGRASKALQRRFDLGVTLVDLVGQFVGLGPGLLELLVFGPQRIAGRRFVARERDLLAAKLTKAVSVAIGEIGRDLDPLPALGADRLGLAVELLRDETVDERDVLEPAAVVALEEVVEYGAAGLDIDVDADELGPLVGRPDRAFRQHAPDGIGLLAV